MAWIVTFSGKAWKQKEKLPVRIRELLFQLAKDIEASGPVRGDWPNYSRLSDNRHHCHLKKGHPTYGTGVRLEFRTFRIHITSCRAGRPLISLDSDLFTD